MPLPGDLTTITVTGTLLDVFGNKLPGMVVFTPSVLPLTDSVGHVVIEGPTTAALDGFNNVNIVLACTDNTNLPAFTYTIAVTLGTAQAAQFPGKAIPHTLGSTVDLTTLLP